MSKIFKKLTVIFLAVLLFSELPVLAFTSANDPYQNYTYDHEGQPRSEPQAYIFEKTIDLYSHKFGGFSTPSDVFISQSGLIYIADSGNNRIVVLSSEYEPIREIKHDFNNPQGVFADEHENVYVADTENGKIVVFDSEGKFNREFGTPNIPLDSQDVEYKPTKISVDDAGRIFVVSRNQNKGIIELDRQGEFVGYYGAIRVNSSFVDQLWRRFMTQTQIEASAQLIPTEYSSCAVDSEGFIYGTVSATGGQTAGSENSVRLLNPLGYDILRRNGFAVPMGDVKTESESDTQNNSKLIDVCVGQTGTYSVLDANKGRVFTYDYEGRLMYVFGGLSDIKGGMGMPVALDITKDGSFLVLDSKYNQLFVYTATQYAEKVLLAVSAQRQRNFDTAEQYWKDILKHTAQSDLAYSGVGDALLRNKDYSGAMKYFKLGNNKASYSTAFEGYRKQRGQQNFPTIMTGCVIALFLIAGILIVKKRRKVKIVNTAQQPRLISEIKFSRHVIFHPFDGFWDLKNEHKGSPLTATIFLLAMLVVNIVARQYTGYIFNPNDPRTLNLFTEIFGTIFPLLLWCVANWAITTLLDGKGTMKDIYMVTCYAMIPLVITSLIQLVLSGILSQNEQELYAIIGSIGLIWTAFLLFAGILSVHQYAAGKTIGTLVIAIIGMAAILFLILLFSGLLQQAVNFFYVFYMEISLRV